MPRTSRAGRRGSGSVKKDDDAPPPAAAGRGVQGGGFGGSDSTAPLSSPPPGSYPAGAPGIKAAAAAAANGNGGSGKNSAATAPGGVAAATADATPPPSEEALVLSYLRRHGLGDAAARLQEAIARDRAQGKGAGETGGGGGAGKRKRSDGDDGGNGEGDAGGDAGGEGGGGRRKKLPPLDYDVGEGVGGSDPLVLGGGGAGATGAAGGHRDALSAATGGGLGYDLDAAPTVALWGAGSAPPSLRSRRASGLLLEGRHRDDEAGLLDKDGAAMVHFRDEARRYIEGFTSLVTWVLALPDDPANPVAGRPRGTAGGKGKGKGKDGSGGEGAGHEPDGALANLVRHSLAAAERDPSRPRGAPPALPLGAAAAIPRASSPGGRGGNNPLLPPPSSKPELLALSFPLLVHTYCELLTCGLEHTALALLDTYRHLYEPSHPGEFADLDQCRSTRTIVGLNEDVIAQSVLHAEMRKAEVRMGQIRAKMKEIEREAGAAAHPPKGGKKDDEREKAAQERARRLARYDDELGRKRAEAEQMSSRNDALTRKLLALPFLRRARALKWNITISTASFSALTAFVGSRDELLPMSALLQSRCHLIVERRDPLPFCPPAVLADAGEGGAGKGDRVRWGAPVHPVVRAVEAGENVPGDTSRPTILARGSDAPPFPAYRPEGSGGSDVAERSAVEFNRALLANGFRRLEALELKREYEAGLLPPAAPGDGGRRIQVADPLAPSALLATLCSSPAASTGAEADAGAGPAMKPLRPWRESNIGVTSASVCPPDGRRVAVGCDDAAVRIWSLDREHRTAPSGKAVADSAAANGGGVKSGQTSSGAGGNASSMGEASMVLLGHKNGFPVFDVDWTRNGRTLLSAGGDGTVRLWDSQAVGPYGSLSNVSVQTKNQNSRPASTSLSTVAVPGSKVESLVEVGGAALCVYRGHAPSTPVWSVASAPSGYYFASAGGDYTARVWTTDRTSPVRILSGHISPSVNNVAWHPNCNYVLTASDDKTCRMFDVQTGRCVRLLSGSSRGLNLVRVSPSGRYAAASGYDGIVRLWDLGNGRLVNELRTAATTTTGSPAASQPQQALGGNFSEGMIHAMSFSSCGAALAVASEDRTVRVWDVRGAGNHLSDPTYFAAARGPDATSSLGGRLGATFSQLGRMPANEQSRPGTRVPTKVFGTNGVNVMDLNFTKRNLLLAVGYY